MRQDCRARSDNFYAFWCSNSKRHVGKLQGQGPEEPAKGGHNFSEDLTLGRARPGHISRITCLFKCKI
jgi:hypothetical protein